MTISDLFSTVSLLPFFFFFIFRMNAVFGAHSFFLLLLLLSFQRLKKFSVHFSGACRLRG